MTQFCEKGDGTAWLWVSHSEEHRMAFERAESDARKVMDAAGVNSFELGSDDDRWLDLFGDTLSAFEEQASALAWRWKRTPRWRRKQRREVLASYIRLEGLVRAARGLETVWR